MAKSRSEVEAGQVGTPKEVTLAPYIGSGRWHKSPNEVARSLVNRENGNLKACLDWIKDEKRQAPDDTPEGYYEAITADCKTLCKERLARDAGDIAS